MFTFWTKKSKKEFDIYPTMTHWKPSEDRDVPIIPESEEVNKLLLVDYFGQKRIKDTLTKFINYSLKNKIQLPHILIIGKPGMGKTTLARIIANELNQSIRILMGGALNSAEEIIENCSHGGIVFIDEIHSLDRKIAENLYTTMENFSYKNEKLPKFTLIGASTEVGSIVKNIKPLYDRFKMVLELDDYSLTDIYDILKNVQDVEYPNSDIKSEDLMNIARNSRCTPRQARSLLEATIFTGSIENAFNNASIVFNGYTKNDVKVLTYLKDSEKEVGEQCITSYLGTTKDNYTYFIEPYLIQTKVIQRLARGRKITDFGLKLLEKIYD